MKIRSKGNLLLAHREKVSDEIHREPDSNPTEREPIDNKPKASKGPDNPACTGGTDDATHEKWCGSWDGARMKRRCDGHGELEDEGKEGGILSTRTRGWKTGAPMLVGRSSWRGDARPTTASSRDVQAVV
eukprot:scaffold420_cov342-Pavlova_lutheri.AAC.10